MHINNDAVTFVEWEAEYFLSVASEDKDRLLLQLMLQVFGGTPDRGPR